MIRIGLCQCKLSFEQPEENLAMMERFLLYAQGCEESLECGDACGSLRVLTARIPACEENLECGDACGPCGQTGGEKDVRSPMTARKADLLLFPELTLTGFTMKSGEFAIRRDSQLIKRVREMAVRYGIAIGFGCVMETTDFKESCAPEEEGGRPTKSGQGESPCDGAVCNPSRSGDRLMKSGQGESHCDGAVCNPSRSGDRPEKSDLGECNPKNTYLIINKEGELLADYAKLHPFSYAGENCHYSPGNSLETFTLNGVRFGMTVCYDLRFPEIYQAYADTCDAIIVAANWPAKRAEHWNALLKARAIETQCYMAAVNCVGNMDGQYYQGDSQLVGPDGENVPGEWESPAAETEIRPQERPSFEEAGEDPCVRQVISSKRRGAVVPEAVKEGILFVDVDEKRVLQARADFPVRQDRRNDFYRHMMV